MRIAGGKTSDERRKAKRATECTNPQAPPAKGTNPHAPPAQGTKTDRSGSQREKQKSAVGSQAISTSERCIHDFAEYNAPGYEVEKGSLDPERTTTVYPGRFTPALCDAESVLATIGVHEIEDHVVRITGGFRGSALVVFDTEERAAAFVAMGYIYTGDNHYHICSMTRAAIHHYVQSLLHGDSCPEQQEVDKKLQQHAKKADGAHGRLTMTTMCGGL